MCILRAHEGMLLREDLAEHSEAVRALTSLPSLQDAHS